ncbi:hypothetical protein J6590_010271 [Homalodisca vitripennis]|nr:hypothetical protein J6590_010271 [Homalodisca vitripennis]
MENSTVRYLQVAWRQVSSGAARRCCQQQLGGWRAGAGAADKCQARTFNRTPSQDYLLNRPSNPPQPNFYRMGRLQSFQREIK